MNMTMELRKPIQWTRLAVFACVGWSIGFVLISVFLISAGKPVPEWPQLYWLKPIIITPLAAASGGACFYLVTYFCDRGTAIKVFGYIAGTLGFVIALWLGSVLGLNGTFWN